MFTHNLALHKVEPLTGGLDEYETVAEDQTASHHTRDDSSSLYTVQIVTANIRSYAMPSTSPWKGS